MVLIFAVTLFISSVLLFLVQPMVGKMILPSLGGTPAVWNTCMVFFQAALLAGYAYAHATVNWLGVRRQAAVHLVVLLIPIMVLPISIAKDSTPPTESNPVFWLLAQLLLRVGLPFFVVSTSAPLFQRWFSRTGHPAAKDPYFLYAASNLGSFLALLAYPVVVEPNLRLANQSVVWAAGYGLLIVMALVCAVVLWRSPRDPDHPAAQEASADSADAPATATPTLRLRLRWILLPLVPSSLMLGVTTHITTDLAPVPLLWIIPLALYLLTFVLVFASKPPIPHTLMVRLFPFLVVVVGVFTARQGMGQLNMPLIPDTGLIPLHLLTFFVAAMVCHGRLAASRPAARHLTEYYLWISVGGVLGGLFNAIIAPAVFNTLFEYPLMMVLACLALGRRTTDQAGSPSKEGAGAMGVPPAPEVRANRLGGGGLFQRIAWSRDRYLDLALPAAVGLVTSGLLFGWYKVVTLPHPVMFVLLTALVPMVLCLGLRKRPFRFALGVAALLAGSAHFDNPGSSTRVYVGRNFFGVKRVIEFPSDNVRCFLHGSITHGAQFTDAARSRQALTYFHERGPIGDVFRAFDGENSKSRIAVLGLGVGSLAAYVKPGQHMTFYEIDPEVEEVARNPALFTFLSQCRGSCDVVLGDGRLTLARAPDKSYGMIFLDAFSSDAVPTHLLTREALDLYLSKLDEDGVLIFNISNRFLDLRPLLGNLADDARLACLARDDLRISEKDVREGKFGSQFLVMARRPADFAELAALPGWEVVYRRPGIPVWTDQFSNILSVLGLG